MRYKILLSGENSAIVKDFFKYTEKYFKCLSTSDVFGDIVGHFELFRPDVFAVFADMSDSETIGQLRQLKNNSCYNSAPIVIIGKQDVCAYIKENYFGLADLFIKRPISPDNLALSILDFLEKTEEERIRRHMGRKHILIVDDDRTVLKMLKTALEDQYEVTAMLNGVLVEKFLESKQVDLIILDYEMPRITGAEIFRMLKGNPDTSHIPVCFLTGVTERSKVEEIMALKPRGYLVKPVDIEMLLATISNLT